MQKSLLHITLLLLVKLFAASATGQEPVFTNITVGNGLSSHHVNAITQDKYGFMWIGTANGLNLYDGEAFTHFYYQPENINSLPGNEVSHLLINGDSLWVATTKGLCLVNVVNRNVVRINTGTNTIVRVIYKERNTNILWVGTNSGLIRLNIEKLDYTEYNTRNSNLQHDIIRALYRDHDQNLWVGTFDKLHKLPKNSSVFEVFNLKEKNFSDIKNNLILSIQPLSATNNQTLWIGTQTGLAIFSRKTNEFKLITEENSELTNASVKTILIAGNHKHWLGTDFGLAETNDSGHILNMYYHDPFNKTSLSNSTVWSSFYDNAGNLWFGTNNGISIYKKKVERFSFLPVFYEYSAKKVGCEINKIVESKDGGLWFSTQAGIMKTNSLSNGNNQFTTFKPEWNSNIYRFTKTIHFDELGRLWVGTNGGIYIWDSHTNKLTNFSASFQSQSGLKSNYIKEFIEIPGKLFLVNTASGLHRLTGDFKNLQNIRFDFITDLSKSKVVYGDGFFWFASSTNLFRLNPENLKIEEVHLKKSAAYTSFPSVCYAHDHKIWFGIQNGLLRYDILTGKDTVFINKNLDKSQIINLIEDNSGNIWGSTNSSLLKFSPSSKEIELFPVENELPITRFEQNSSMKGSDGSVYIGGQDGVVRFLPEKVVKSNYLPPVMITSLSVQNQAIEPGVNYQGNVILDKPVSFSSSVVLDYEQRLFSLNFSTLEFGNRQGLRYAYLLEGIDSDWNFVSGQKGSATYSRIPAGMYIFRVKGTNSDGVWSTIETTLQIKIRPPFWARPVFIFIYVVLVIGLAGAIVYYYFNKLKWQNDLRIIRIEKDHAEELSKTKMQFFTNIFHEFRTPLSLIIGPLEKLARNESLDTSAKNMVELIGKNALRIIRLNDQLLDFRLLENKKTHLKISEFEFVGFARNIFMLFTDKASRKKIDYRFEPETDQIEVKMDAEKIETILFNLLSNAFKFTNTQGIIEVKTGLCSREIQHKPTNCLYFIVRDEGIGISEKDQARIFERYYQSDDALKMERGSGIGLTLVDEYVKMHSGEISVKSEIGKGSEFRIFLPLDQSVYESAEINPNQENSQPVAVTSNSSESAKIDSNTILISGKPLILLVEDDHELSGFIAQCLRGKYNILTAFDGNEGLRKAEKQIPDLVITDIVLPGLDGIALTRKLKKNARTAHIPVIILSAQSDKQNQLEGLQKGADAFMSKPFEMEHLEARIANFITHRKQLVNYLKIDKATNPKIKETVSVDEKMFQKIVSGIERNLSDPDLSIEKLAKETGFSQSIIYRKIKNMTGLTTNELIRKVRLQHAEQLLKTKKFSVSEVMDQVGFSNHSYFSKCFRKLYQMSPKEYMDNV